MNARLVDESIAIVTPSFYPMIGGVETYVMKMGSELMKRGYNVHVFTPDSVLGRRFTQREAVVDGMQVHRVRVRVDLSYRLRWWPGLVNALQSHPIDLVHVYSHDSYALYALMATRKAGLPLVLTTYGPFVTHSEYGIPESSILRIYDSIITPSLFSRSSAVLVRYPSLIDWVVSLGVERERVYLEPSGIPREYLVSRDDSGFRERIGHQGQLIVYLGRIGPQKGVQHALEAMYYVSKSFPDAKLVLIGPDYLGYSAFLKRRAAALNIPQNLVILEALTDENEECEALAACDVFVMPSSFEGFSQAVMKAMAQSRPVVVTDVGGLPFEVDYGKCGIICHYGDARALAGHIMELLRSSELRRNLGTRGRERAEQFTFDRLAKDLSRVYETLIN